MNRVIFGDCRETMRDLAAKGVRVQCCVTSPPYYGLRDYGRPGQIGLEKTPAEYVAALVEVFEGVRELLADDGVLWLNLGDSYGPGKQLGGMPWRVAFALQEAGWYLRQDVIWHKPNPMPESVTDRCTKAHEYLFLLTKSERYFWDAEAMQEASVDPEGSAKRYEAPFWQNGKHQTGGYSADGAKHTAGMKQFDGRRNRRSVWTVPTKPYSGAHFAVFPPELIEPCVLAGSRQGDLVLDPFMGSGTTAEVAQKLGRRWIGCELNPAYEPLQQQRVAQCALEL